MKIDREQWRRLSALLDTALDVSAGDREAWLDSLPSDAATLREPLRRLLAQRAHIETGDFLKTPDFAAALRAETARLREPNMELQPGSDMGPYRLLRELGRGGMGSVWLSERNDGRLKRQVALKFPYAGPHQRQLAERLARERDILAGLEHAHIARLYDADVSASGQPFLVLEYVNGAPINDYCDQHRLTIRERLMLFRQVLGAVQYAHTHLVIHRDLKPSNILITNDGIARLLDFGIAKLVSDGEAQETAITQLGGRALTPDYASPEQITGQPITTTSDIYSLGVVLYELLTGAPPYRLKRGRASLEDAIAEAQVIAPSRTAAAAELASMRSTTVHQLLRQLRGDLDTILLKALSKQAKDRYATVDALARDIERSLNGEPVDAQPHSRLYLFRKLVLRHKLAFGAAGLVLLSLTVGIGATTWQAARARASEQRAIAEANTSEAVKQFMIRIFQTNTLAQEDPAKARQKNALELLEAGANRVGIEFKNDPALHRELLAVILRLLGESRSGEYKRHALELIGLLTGVPGGELQQADIYDELAIMEEAKDRERSAVFAQSGLTVLGMPVDAEHRKLRAKLLTSYARARQFSAGPDATAHTLMEARKLLADDFAHSAEYADVLEQLGWVEIRRDHTQAAVDYFEQALGVYQSDPSAFQRSVARGRYNLAAGFLVRKQYAAAERELRLASELFAKSYGADDPQTAFNNARLASVITLQNRFDDALALLGSAVQALEKPSPQFNADYFLAGLEYLSNTLVRAGRLDDADTAVPRMLKHAAEGPPIVQIEPLLIAAEYDFIRGRYDSAEAGARQAVDRVAQAYGSSSPKMAKYQNALGRLLAGIGKLQEADALFAANMQADAANAASFNSVWTVAALQHAKVLTARGQGQEALPGLTATLQKYLAQPVDQRDINDEVELRLALGRAQLASGHAAEALPHLERALELRQTQYAFSPRIAEAQVVLADCKLRLGDTDGSRVLYAKAKAIQAANPQLGKQYRLPLKELSRRLAAAVPASG